MVQAISGVIILFVFIGALALIVKEKVNRAIVALAGAIITFYILIEFEKFDYSVIIDLVLGTKEDNFVEFRALILILSMMLIIDVSQQAGVFQFISFRLIQLTKGSPLKLLGVLCTLATILTAIVNNLLAIIILIPLTFSISKILNVNPVPYVLSETYFVTIGGTILSISSIPSILISFNAGISFGKFFINIGLVSIFVYFCTLLLFLAIFSNKLEKPHEGIEILLDYDVWSLVVDIKLMLKALATLIGVLIAFIVVPSNIATPDVIALIAALFLMVISKLDAEKIFEKVDLELLLYLMGISIIVGAMDLLGLIDAFGKWLANWGNGDVFFTIMIVLWTSGFLSAAVDDISITKVMIPVVRIMTQGFSAGATHFTYYALNWGINFGDNMTPFGDTIIVFNLAKKYEHPITFKSYFQYGLTTAFFNLIIISIYISLQFNPLIGIVFILGLIGIIVAVFFKRIQAAIIKHKERKLHPPQNQEDGLGFD